MKIVFHGVPTIVGDERAILLLKVSREMEGPGPPIVCAEPDGGPKIIGWLGEGVDAKGECGMWAPAKKWVFEGRTTFPVLTLKVVEVVEMDIASFVGAEESKGQQ